jgi:hypothetical protein
MFSKTAMRTSNIATHMISQVYTAPSNIKEAKKQAIDSSDDTEICLQCK